MNKGQVLNEAVIAMGIITLTVIGSFGFMAKAISYNRFISDQSTAVHLAAEGIEIAKNILDAKVFTVKGQPAGAAWRLIQSVPLGCYEVDYKSSSFSQYTGRFLSIDYDNSVTPPIYTFYTYTPGQGSKQSIFQRKVCLTSPTGSVNEVSITSLVNYKAKTGLLNHVEVSTSIFNWR